jgi:exopolyphosphatase/guanosine-5'-triphosphate,3'-diphosphate pyrophosphatase
MKDTASPTLVAVLEIGSRAIRMTIAEINAKAEIRILEKLQKPVAFAQDVFTTGRISRSSMIEGITILSHFKSVIEGYGVKKIQAVATIAVREAQNRDIFIDRVFVRTGMDIEVIEGPEENRLNLISLEHALSGKFPLQEKNCLILEVGSGSTEMIVLDHGHVEFTRTLALGSFRLPDQAIPAKTEPATIKRVLKRSIHNIVGYRRGEYNPEKVDTFIVLGADMRFASEQLAEKTEEPFVLVDKKNLLKWVDQMASLSPEELVNRHGISFTQAETLYPSLLIYTNFLNETKAETILISKVSIRDGLLLELSQMLSGYKRTDVGKQVIHSAQALGEKYQYDKMHAACVASLAIKIFDQMASDHGMGIRERLLLEVSAILHDIGIYISASSHHKHSSYLIDAAEIFGLRKEHKNILSNVVRYHRKTVPNALHESYMSLQKSDRAVVSKLAAFLRVADSLDVAHQQRVKNFTLEKQADTYTLWVSEDLGDISLERNSLHKKSDWFSDVFGIPIVLKQGELKK